MMEGAIANRVDEKYKELFSKTYSLSNMLEHFKAGESCISMELVRIINGENIWSRVVALMPDTNVETGRIYVYYYRIDPVRIGQIEDSRRNRAMIKQQSAVEETFEEIYRLRPDEEFIYETGGVMDKLNQIDFVNEYNTFIMNVGDNLIHPDEANEFKTIMHVENLWAEFKNKKMQSYVFRRLSKDNEYLWTEYRITAINWGVFYIC